MPDADAPGTVANDAEASGTVANVADVSGTVATDAERLIQLHVQADAEGGAGGEGRTVVIGLGLEIEDVVDGRVDTYASPKIVLQNQAPDGISLIHIGAPGLRMPLAAA